MIEGRGEGEIEVLHTNFCEGHFSKILFVDDLDASGFCQTLVIVA